MKDAWWVVAFALVVSTLVKGCAITRGHTWSTTPASRPLPICAINLYEATLRRSSSFFHKHATGTILSTLINDVDRVQVAVSFLSSAIFYSSFSPS